MSMEKNKVSIFTCFCACLLTAILTAAIILAFRVLPRLTRNVPYTTEDKLAEAARVIRKNYIGDLDESALADYAIDGMVDSLGDRWSYYMTAEEVADYLKSTENSYGGIGIVVREVDGYAVVYKVYEHSPAGEAGIVAGSRFLSVNGEDTSGMDMDGVVARIREMIQTGRVELRMLSPTGTEQAYSLVPGDVYTDPVSYRILPEGFGYIRLENFESRSAEDAIAAVEELLSQGAAGFIFDMRENPGGQLTELLKLLDYLLPEGELFISRMIDGSEHIDYSGAGCVNLPMVVLINEDTYSAAEFFAAALREYEWALLVGAQTSGKGYAQITVNLSDGSAIHISHIAYYTPNGISLAGVGLTPDLIVDMGAEERSDLYYGLLEPEKDPQLQAALKSLAEAAQVSP